MKRKKSSDETGVLKIKNNVLSSSKSILCKRPTTKTENIVFFGFKGTQVDNKGVSLLASRGSDVYVRIDSYGILIDPGETSEGVLQKNINTKRETYEWIKIDTNTWNLYKGFLQKYPRNKRILPQLNHEIYTYIVNPSNRSIAL